jgi:hypothetical protein
MSWRLALACVAAALCIVCATADECPHRERWRECPHERPKFSLARQMQLALVNCCAEDVRRVLAAGVNASGVDRDGKPWALLALRTHPMVNLPVLQAAGLNMSARYPGFPKSLIHGALHNQQEDVAAWLLSPHGGNVTAGVDELVQAAQTCKPALLQMVIRAHAAEGATIQNFSRAVSAASGMWGCCHACRFAASVPAHDGVEQAASSPYATTAHESASTQCVNATLRMLLAIAPAGVLNERTLVHDDSIHSWSPLHVAAHAGTCHGAGSVELLLDAGADPQVVTSDGKTAAELAGDTDTATLLVQRGVPVREQELCSTSHAVGALLQYARRHNVTSVLEQFRRARCEDGRTLLASSIIRSKRWERDLIEVGVNVSHRDVHGATALHYAVHESVDAGAVNMLLRAGAVNDLDVELPASQWMHCFQPTGQAEKDCAQAYLDADLGLVQIERWASSGGQTAVTMAAKQGFMVLRALLGCRCSADHDIWAAVAAHPRKAERGQLLPFCCDNVPCTESPFSRWNHEFRDQCPFQAWPLPASAARALKVALQSGNGPAAAVLVNAGVRLTDATADS